MNREEFQTERTRIISEMLDNPDEYGIYPTTKCFEQLDALFDSLSLSPAEGAEEILQKTTLSDTSVPNVPLSWLIAPESPTWNAVIAAMHEFATLHAQLIADKMVSERLRNELMRYDQWLLANDMGQMFDDTMKCVDEYLKTREK